MDDKRTVNAELIPSLDFLHNKLSTILTADEKAKQVLFKEIEQKIAMISDLLHHSDQGKALKERDEEKFNGISNVIGQIDRFHREKRKHLAEAKGAKVFGTVSGAIVGGSVGIAANGSQSASPSTDYGSPGSSNSFSSGWKIAVGTGIILGSLGFLAIATKYYKTNLSIRIEGGRRLVIEFLSTQPPTSSQHAMSLQNQSSSSSSVVASSRGPANPLSAATPSQIPGNSPNVVPLANNPPVVEGKIDIDVIGFLELLAASAALLKFITSGSEQSGSVQSVTAPSR